MADAVTPNDRAETVKVVNENSRTGYAIINKSDFNEDEHEIFEEEDEEEDDTDADGDGIPDRLQRVTNADRTFDEPTPTDIRYGNKDDTEFANNHGSKLGNSAAELREGAGLPQKPGGLNPDQFKKVEEAEAAKRDALTGSPRGKLVRKVLVEDDKSSKSKAKAKGKGKGKSKKKAPVKSSADEEMDDKSKSGE